MPVDPDRACPHADFLAEVKVNRLSEVEDGPITGYHADVKIICSECGEPFKWKGLRAGISPAQPRVSFDGLELRAPIWPASDDRSGLR